MRLFNYTISCIANVISIINSATQNINKIVCSNNVQSSKKNYNRTCMEAAE